jgi:hypothetical protein
MLDVNGVTFLSTAEAAEQLGLSAGHLRNRRSDRRSPLPFQRIGSGIYYRLDDVQRLAAERAR